MYRKSSPLNQSDVAFIMQLPDYSNISRWEHGQRTPNVDVLFVYHLLFGTPVENLLDQQKGNTNKVVIERIKLLLAELQARNPSQKVTRRVVFLESVLTKLSS